jgi:acyl carrier protein
MIEQNQHAAITLDPAELRDILVTDVGIDAEQLAEQPTTSLADLGLDSMAQVELGVVLEARHGVTGIPEHTSTMSFDELAGHLCGAV